MIKGAPVTPEASTISGASATTEVQNNSAEVQNNSASASDPVDAEAPAKILIPLEHWFYNTRSATKKSGEERESRGLPRKRSSLHPTPLVGSVLLTLSNSHSRTVKMEPFFSAVKRRQRWR